MDCTVYQTSDKPVCCKGNRVVIESIIQSRTSPIFNFLSSQ